MTLRACASCGNHILSTDQACPHCQKQPKNQAGKIAMAALLGLAMTGCGSKNEDTATTEPAAEPTSEPAVEPEYGVGMTE